MTIVQRLLDTAQMRTQFPEWLCKELEAAAEEITRLRGDCAEAYQVIGAGMLGDPVPYAPNDVERVLDNLSAAASGTPRPHDDLLPWPR